MLNFLNILLAATVKYVNSDNTMVIVWGKPTSFYNPTPYVNTTLNWIQCVQECYNFERCVLAYQNSTGCNLYVFNGMPSVKKTNSTQDFQVAFKVQGFADTCPVGTNPPTFNNKNASGYLYVTDNVYYPQKVWYNISLSGSSWKLTYTTSSLCPSNYNTYVTYADGRQNCVIILWSNMTVGGYQNVSDTTCKQFGGTLPTLNFPIDVDVFTYLANLYRNNFASSEFYIRIDGVRTKSCQSNPNSTECLTPEGFTFTDPSFLNSFQQYDWVTNAGAKEESDDNCLVLVYPNTTKFMQVDVRSAAIDVTKTNATDGSIVAFKVDTEDRKCPSGANPPTFDNQNATGSLNVDYDTNFFPKCVYYTIYEKGNTWQISYTLNNSCTSDFIDIVERSDGTSICVTGFTFTGPPVENFENYNWVTDPSAQETPDDNCIILVANGSNPIQMDVRRYTNGSEVQKLIHLQLLVYWISIANKAHILFLSSMDILK
ncbi:Protein CBG06159 [Caenorhabditis briggsae]|uniref:Protein CBG06159 n=1 Tax=Caenorhabditis briggsae TaxID=6238 RepID=A8X0S5_CAEBR|nr:Protein CBG06159 [Caenorhabditis briggsae]CAP26235.2 Protein CBG06159 [Caenorhabditis briggsae]